jgi:hypothetical protein
MRRERREALAAAQLRNRGASWPFVVLGAGYALLGVAIVASSRARRVPRGAKWREKDSNLRRRSHLIYSQAPLTARVSRRAAAKFSDLRRNLSPRPTV